MYISVCCCCFFFFFQAEDGIRDLYVTGVQTCALPISRAAPAACPSARKRACRPSASCRRRASRRRRSPSRSRARRPPPRGTRAPPRPRSEERRVGKECRSRWSPEQEKKKEQGPKKRHQ